MEAKKYPLHSKLGDKETYIFVAITQVMHKLIYLTILFSTHYKFSVQSKMSQTVSEYIHVPELVAG
jgi:hypothetical protein